MKNNKIREQISILLDSDPVAQDYILSLYDYGKLNSIRLILDNENHNLDISEEDRNLMVDLIINEIEQTVNN